jgi:predicted nucleotidyltransferase component of viral defense system
MIPINSINSWRQHAPWALQSQVEQDLVLSRALVLLYQQEIVRDSLAFRGGTALNKLFCGSLARYSEDIDMVHIKKGVFGNVMTAIRETLDPMVGHPSLEPKRESGQIYLSI